MSSPSEDQRRYEDAALRESRYNTLGFISGGVPMSLGHKAYLEDKEREAARQQAASAPRAQKVQFEFSDEDVPRLTASKATFDDLAPKWAWILNGKGGFEPVPIIEDSGTTENFISPAQVEQFGFGTRSTTPRLFTQVSGDGFVVHELVDVIWYSNNVQETTHFYVAPPEIPYGMVVGRDFIQEHPGALMDQKPAEAMMLTVQAKAKKNESDAIHSARERMRSQAEEIRRRRQKTHVDDAQPSTASSSRQSTLADVKSWTAHAGEKK